MKVAQKLKQSREARHLSPEDLEAKIRSLGGGVSSSYIRRLEKGQNVPTVEVLQWIVDGLDTNLGRFFEEFDEPAEVETQDRRFQRILQRGLESPYRQEIIALMKLIDTKIVPVLSS